MNQRQHRTTERDLAGALRAQRRADAVVAQYLRELSHPQGAEAVEPVTGGEAGHDGAAVTAWSR